MSTGLDRFEVGRAVAPAGAVGVVLQAVMDAGTARARQVALTLLDPALVDPHEAVRGWADAACATHPALVAPIEFGVDAGVPFVATPWLAGHTLREIAQAHQRAGRCPPARLLASIGAEVADALASLDQCVDPHGAARPLVHGQLGPSRVMVLDTGHVRVLGFPSRTPRPDPSVRAFYPDGPADGPADAAAVARLLVSTCAGADPATGPEALRRESPELAQLLEQGQDRQTARWLAAHLRKWLADHGGPLGPADWRVLLEELPVERGVTDRAAAREIAARLLRRSPPALEPRTPTLGLWGAIAAGVVVSLAVRAARLSAGVPVALAASTAAVPIEAPAPAPPP
ncbi:MAG: hypothetical protein ABMA64_42435, partial [Myxococcota bacterium]